MWVPEQWRPSDYGLRRRAASSRLCISETIVRRSSASSLVMTQCIRASCAVGFRNIPKVPFTRFAKPVCPLFSLSVLPMIDDKHGLLSAKRSVHQRAAIISEARQAAYLVPDALHRFLHHGNSCRRAALHGKTRVRGDVRPAPQGQREAPVSAVVLPQASSQPKQGSVFPYRQRQARRKLIPDLDRHHRLEALWFTTIACWAHRQPNELQNMRVISARV